MAKGYTNRGIAELLGLSVRTVDVHRYWLMHRLQVDNVAQLLRRGLSLRLLSRKVLKRHR